jgi:hypothetical protein
VSKGRDSSWEEEDFIGVAVELRGFATVTATVFSLASSSEKNCGGCDRCRRRPIIVIDDSLFIFTFYFFV